jgi:cytochrome c oxidase subunit 1
LSMGAVFAIFAGWYYWIGKIIGNQYNELLGKIHFWSTFIGVNVCFFSYALSWFSGNAS